MSSFFLPEADSSSFFLSEAGPSSLNGSKPGSVNSGKIDVDVVSP